MSAPLAVGALVLSGLTAVPAVADESPDPGSLRSGLASHLDPQQADDRGRGRLGPGVSAGTFATQAAGKRQVGLVVKNLEAAPDAQRRLDRVTVVHDRAAGRVIAHADFAAAPTVASNSVLEVLLGTMSLGTCSAEAGLAAVAHGTPGGVSSIEGSDGEVTRTLAGKRLTVRSTSHAGQVKAAEWDCAFAVLRHPSELETVWQRFVARDLDGRIVIQPGRPVQGNYAGKVTTVRVDVRNDSGTPVTGVRIRAAGKGMKIAKPVRNLGTLERRSTRYGVVYKVRLQGAKARRLVLRVTSEGRTFTKRITIARKPKRTIPHSLENRYYWGFMPASADTGWDLRAAWFHNNGWVRVGFAKAGARPNCRKVTKVCKRYTYNPRTGVVTFAGKRAKVTNEGFTHKRATYQPTTLAKKGQRFKLELIRHDFNGMCGIYCNTWTEWLSMSKNGRFVLSRQSIGSLGPPGVGSIWGSVPPSSRGTYRVIAPGRIQLDFANGKKQRHTFAIQHDIRNKPAPAGEGVVLGDRNFYFDD